MADTRTPEQRRRIMAAVRSRDTRPEVRLRKALYAIGVRGWRCHYRRAPGKPDLAWPARKAAVFVDGAFWHGHPSKHRPGRSGDYWDRKIARNVERDRRVDRELAELGWAVERVWDFEIERDLDAVAQRVATLVETLSRTVTTRTTTPNSATSAETLGRTQDAPDIRAYLTASAPPGAGGRSSPRT